MLILKMFSRYAPPLQKRCVVHWRFLNWEDPLEKGMATYSSILAWRIPWTEEPLGLQSMGSQRVRHNYVTNTFTYPWKGMQPWAKQLLSAKGNF